MAPLVSTIDINRPQDEVFAYVTDPSTFAEWQAGRGRRQHRSWRDTRARLEASPSHGARR